VRQEPPVPKTTCDSAYGRPGTYPRDGRRETSVVANGVPGGIHPEQHHPGRRSSSAPRGSQRPDRHRQAGRRAREVERRHVAAGRLALANARVPGAGGPDDLAITAARGRGRTTGEGVVASVAWRAAGRRSPRRSAPVPPQLGQTEVRARSPGSSPISARTHRRPPPAAERESRSASRNEPGAQGSTVRRPAQARAPPGLTSATLERVRGEQLRLHLVRSLSAASTGARLAPVHR